MLISKSVLPAMKKRTTMKSRGFMYSSPTLTATLLTLHKMTTASRAPCARTRGLIRRNFIGATRPLQFILGSREAGTERPAPCESLEPWLGLPLPGRLCQPLHHLVTNTGCGEDRGRSLVNKHRDSSTIAAESITLAVGVASHHDARGFPKSTALPRRRGGRKP
jgi:hypothetical protein